MTEIVEGQVLAGKYRVERVLGIGGMGMVVSALHLQLDERVAIKFMLPEAFASAEAVTRFAREARAAVKIKSEHVARVSDVGMLETGAPYMVMEYLEGSDLSAWLKQHGRLSVEQSVEFVLQAAEAIAEAHSLGIVHRDLKPANLFVVRRPSGGFSVKVLDFGISKVTRSGSPDLGVTKSSATMGSPLYMSPELVADARAADPRCDIWALGVILYELLCGVTPFVAESLYSVLLLIATAAPAPVRSRAPHVPPGLDAAILRCLEKEPNRRYANVAELAAALIDFAPPRARVSLERIVGVLGTGEGSTTQREHIVSPPQLTSNSTSNPSSASWGATSPSRSPNRRALIGVGSAILTVVVLVGATLMALRSRASGTPTATSSESPAKSAPTLALGSMSARTSSPPSVAATSTTSAPALSATLAALLPAISASAALTSAKPPPAAAIGKDATTRQPRSDVPSAPPRPVGVYDERK